VTFCLICAVQRYTYSYLLTYVTLLRRPTYMRINIVTQLLGSEETRHLGQLSLLSLRGR